MAINQTLVDAAFKVGTSNIPIIDPGLAKRQAELPGLMLDPIQKAIVDRDKAIEESNKTENKKKDVQIQNFVKNADAITSRLSTYDRGGREAGMHDQIFNKTFDFLGELKSEYEMYNTTGEDDTADNKKKRTEIMGRLDAIKNSTVQLRSDILEIGKLAGSEDGSQVSPTMNKTDLAVINEIINMDGDYSNVNVDWNPNTNQMDFSVLLPEDFFSPEEMLNLSEEEQIMKRTVTWPQSSIKERFVKIPKKLEANILESSKNVVQDAKKSKIGDKFNLQLHIDGLADNFEQNSDLEVGHIFQSRLDGQPKEGWDAPGGTSKRWKPGSWANAMESSPDLNGDPYTLSSDVQLDVIENLLLTGGLSQEDVQLDDDPSISPAELEAVMNKENRDKIIDVYVNPANPLFNRQRSIEEYCRWKGLGDEQTYYDNQPKPEIDGLEGSLNI